MMMKTRALKMKMRVGKEKGKRKKRNKMSRKWMDKMIRRMIDNNDGRRYEFASRNINIILTI